MVEVNDSSHTLLAKGMIVNRVVVRIPHIEAYDTTSQVQDWYTDVDLHFTRILGVTDGNNKK